MTEVKPALAERKCQPCEGGMDPLSRAEAERLMGQLANHWKLDEAGTSIVCEVRFKNFAQALTFLNRLADEAESEGHHPDFCLKGWNNVSVALSTHAIGGLSENDFILAAKADRALEQVRG